MTSRISSVFRRALGGQLLVLLVLATFTSLTPARAEAQSSDTWKSIAIIGGTTAAGAYIGHKVAGRTGAYVGAAAGAAGGYAIDRRRRQNVYNNGYYGNSNYGGYYGNPSYQNAGPGSPYPYGSGYQSNGYYRDGNRYSSHR